MGEQPEIVLVEDNADDEKLVQRALYKAGIEHRLIVLRDGDEASAWFEGHRADGTPKEKLPRLVLMDHRVPKISGLELLRLMRSDQRFASVPIVMMSSGAEHRDLSEYFTAGANSVIAKHVDWSEAMEKLAGAVRYWLFIHRPGI